MKVYATRYRSIVGELRYLTHTRPDISFAVGYVGYVSHFMEDPREDHLTAVKHLLRYIVGTCGYGIIYPQRGTATLELSGYSDSDMAGDVDGCPGSHRSRGSSHCPHAKQSTSRR